MKTICPKCSTIACKLDTRKGDYIFSANHLDSNQSHLPLFIGVDATGATDLDGACFTAEPATADPSTNAFMTSSLLMRPCF